MSSKEDLGDLTIENEKEDIQIKIGRQKTTRWGFTMSVDTDF